MAYRFYGWETANQKPMNPMYDAVGDPKGLYDLLCRCWTIDTCAPRLRENWSEENRTLGQCSITSFLVQDIFGGQVYGIPLPDGGVHCYNVVDGIAFDLTSEQFGDTVLCYENNPVQYRDMHFADRDKKRRYNVLKQSLIKEIAPKE